MAFNLCADFRVFPDNAPLGPTFTLAGMDFDDISGGPPASFVNVTAGDRGLQFPNTGLEVDLPVPVSRVRLRLGQFNAPFTVEGLNLAGTVVSTFVTNFPNSYQNVRLRGPDMDLLRFTGGGNEGIIVFLCITIP